jgi:hypothetical protein
MYSCWIKIKVAYPMRGNQRSPVVCWVGEPVSWPVVSLSLHCTGRGLFVCCV